MPDLNSDFSPHGFVCPGCGQSGHWAKRRIVKNIACSRCGQFQYAIVEGPKGVYDLFCWKCGKMGDFSVTKSGKSVSQSETALSERK